MYWFQAKKKPAKKMITIKEKEKTKKKTISLM